MKEKIRKLLEHQGELFPSNPKDIPEWMDNFGEEIWDMRYEITKSVLWELSKELDRPRWFYEKEREALNWLQTDLDREKGKHNEIS